MTIGDGVKSTWINDGFHRLGALTTKIREMHLTELNQFAQRMQKAKTNIAGGFIF